MREGNVAFEDAQIVLKNFSGKPSEYNRDGKKYFCVVISDPAVAASMKAEGWNIRQFKARDDDEKEPDHYLQVAVSFENIPPKIFLITKNAKTLLDEDSVAVLDYADIVRADLIIRPYDWSVRGETGRKAYLKTMYVTIEEDQFEDRYRDINDDSGDAGDELPFDM